MQSSDKDSYRATLGEVARRLVIGHGLPIDVSGVCRALGIRIAYGNLPGKARAAVISHGSGVEIRLSQPTGEASRAFERFLIAHELAHIILQRECAAVPMGASEYWQHEQLCDEFAGTLLVPTPYLEHSLRKCGRTAIDCLIVVGRLSGTAVVPWRIAAARISHVCPELAFFKAKHIAESGKMVQRLKITISSLPHKKGVGQFISYTSRLGRTLAGITAERNPVPLDVSMFKDFPACQGANMGAVMSTGQDEFRLVAKWTPQRQASHPLG